jgi:hypothetical protein
MSQTKAQILNPINGNLNVSGIITASSFVGNGSGLTGVASTDNIRTATNANFLANVSIGGSLTVNGTQTIINTQTLDITDKNIGIGSTSTPSDALADGAGLTIYGTTNKTLTWDNSNTRLAFSTNVYSPKYYGDGSSLTGISVGLGTEALISSGITTTLNLTKQDHKLTVSGITTITVSGGTEGESHTVRIVNSGITTIGFSTAFLWPGGSTPSLPTTSGAISLLSFTVHRVGAAGTQLLAGASQNFS